MTASTRSWERFVVNWNLIIPVRWSFGPAWGGEQELFCAPWLREFLGRYQFLSRRCYYTYLANAQRQLKRITSTHHKAVETPPAPAVAEDYAVVVERGKAISLRDWLREQQLLLNHVAARRLVKGEDVYALYRHSTPYGLFGKDGTGISAPSIPETAPLLGMMLFRVEAYSRQNRLCAQYREWVQKRNPQRLVTSAALSNKQGAYDVKHMGHVFRLLHTAEEIAREGRIHVRRTWDNAFLRRVRAGEFPLSELLQRAEDKMAALKGIFEHSDLPEVPLLGNLWDELAELRIRLHDEHH